MARTATMNGKNLQDVKSSTISETNSKGSNVATTMCRPDSLNGPLMR